MRVFPVTLGPLQENAYLVETGEGPVLIDPGDEPEKLLALFQTTGLTPRAILLTHAHFDHVGAVAPLVEALDLPVYLHPLDLPLYEGADLAARAWGLAIPKPPLPVRPLEEGMGLFGFQVLHLPGHSPGHVAFYDPEGAQVFSGDLLFRADPKALFASLKRLLSLPPETRVHPGHGPGTTLGLEARTNPFLTGLEWEA